MKSYTPLKRHQALVTFSREHHFGLLLVWKIKQGLANAIAPERISNYVLYFFESDLQHHFKEEEELLFPKLPATDPLRVQAEQEHAVLYDLVDQIRADKTNPDLLARFAESLKAHIRFEERQLFVSMQQTLTDDELAMIAAHDRKQACDADTKWYDVFWVENRSGL